MKKKPLSLKILITSLLFIATLITLHLLFQYLNILVFNEKNLHVFEFSNRFDFDDESSVPTWFSQLIFLIISFAALLTRHYESDKNKRRTWLLVAFVYLLFSIDEVASFHETLLQSLHLLFLEEGSASAFSNAWLFIAPLIFLGLFAILRMCKKTFPPKTFKLLAIGASITVAGAILIDILVVEVDSASFLSQGFLVALEESLEIIGGIIVLFAIVKYLEKNHPQSLQLDRKPLEVAKK